VPCFAENRLEFGWHARAGLEVSHAHGTRQREARQVALGALQRRRKGPRAAADRGRVRPTRPPWSAYLTPSKPWQQAQQGLYLRILWSGVPDGERESEGGEREREPLTEGG
jgi:hypothetical protein